MSRSSGFLTDELKHLQVETRAQCSSCWRETLPLGVAATVTVLWIQNSGSTDCEEKPLLRDDRSESWQIPAEQAALLGSVADAWYQRYAGASAQVMVISNTKFENW